MLDFKSIFQEKTHNFSIYPRRFGIKEGKTHLYGPPKSGKTSLALLFAKEFKNPIYIHCKDPRNQRENIQKDLLKSFLEKRLDLLILDDYEPLFELPNIKNIILITSQPHCFIPQNFQSKAIAPLNFEEYISINKNQTPINQLLNTFIKEGNLPEILNTPDHLKVTKKQELMQRIFQENYPIFQALLSFQSQNITIHQLYTYLKRSFKISKDKLYALLHSLQEQEFIHLLEHKTTKNSAKKLYFYDFSLPYAFSPEPNFQAIFENMVFFELKSQFQNLLQAHHSAHFIYQNILIFAIAFPNHIILDKLSQKYPQNHIVIIALNPLKHPHCEVIDFISFALREYQEQNVFFSK